MEDTTNNEDRRSESTFGSFSWFGLLRPQQCQSFFLQALTDNFSRGLQGHPRTQNRPALGPNSMPNRALRHFPGLPYGSVQRGPRVAVWKLG